MHYFHHMLTTIDIDPDVFHAAETLAARSRRSMGDIISDMLRVALKQHATTMPVPAVLNGFEVIPAAGRVVTPEQVQRLIEKAECA